MRYLLNGDFALRSFIGVAHCFYRKGFVKAQKLTREEFDFLVRCDGEHELPDTGIPTERVRNMIHPAGPGETLSEWQEYRHCDNRYFPAVSWMLTGKCNYNCLHCFNAADNAPLASEWSWEDAEILMDEARKCGVNAFVLTGGEPMLHPYFMHIVRGIYERGMFIYELNTNGSFLTPQILEEFDRIGAKPLMKISFDGLGCHDWLRNRKGAEEQALGAIRLCIENGFPVKAQMNVHRQNIGSVEKTLELLESKGAVHTRIIRTSESPRWSDLGGGQTLTFREYYEHMLAFSESWLSKPHRMKVTIWHMDTLPPAAGTAAAQAAPPSEWDRLMRYRRQAYACSDARFLAAVTAEGDMVPCMPMSGRFTHDGTHLGNIKGGGLQEVLKTGPYLDTVCLTVEEMIESDPDCRKCSHFIDCRGGCRAIALIMTDDLMKPDPSSCIYYKEGYAERMAALLRNAACR